MSYIFGGSTGETPESIARKREIANAMIARSMSRAPRDVGEGIASIGNALAYRAMMGRTDQAEARGRDSGNEAFGRVLEALGGSASPNTANTANAAPSPYRNAIAAIESRGSGDYNAVGPTHERLGRALGRYQIMEANIAPWSKEAIGRSVSADEFMSSPQIQDQIFDHRFGQYVDRFGEEGAAQAWFGGEGGVGKVNRRDSLGTTIGGYGQKFMSELGRGSQPLATPQPQTSGGGMSIADLAQVASNPWLSRGQNAVVNALLQQRIGAGAQGPVKGIEVDGRLVNPYDGSVIYEGAPKPGYEMLSQDQAQSLGLGNGAFQRGPNGRITKIGGGGVNINMPQIGSIPKGYQLITDPETQSQRLEPIPGGPVAEAEENREEAETDRASLVATEIDRALNLIDNDGVVPATGAGAMLSPVPGTDAKALSSLLDTIRANIGFAELNAMRAQSPTGGALGQVTERELAFLQSVAGSLDQAQNEQQLRDNLNRLWNTYQDVIHGKENGPERRKLSFDKGGEGVQRRLRYNPATGALE